MRNDSEKAALYLRSSKDRSDVSPAAQRHALEALATSRSLLVTETFEDAVESGATEDRPAFSKLLRSIKDAHRGWSYLLVYDTSRIARRRYIAQALKHECKKRGITILYATRPADVDPISEVVLDSMLEAMDEVHSLMSRQKGLAGMAENVRQGFRAGGRAPLGYQLKMFPTGAIRDGRAVTKSRLEPSQISHQVRAYLRGRARGVPRRIARSMAGLTESQSTLVCIEWNALTYAGHTVWNVNREPGSGSKRRPRDEWQVTRDTHAALISEVEAERILAQLQTSNISAAIRASRAEKSRFLLAGLLYTTDGRAWNGHGKHYRLRRDRGRTGRIVPAEKLDAAVAETLQAFRTGDRYLAWLIEQTRKAEEPVAPGGDLIAQIRKLERERARAAEAAISGDGSEAYAALVAQRSRQIDALNRELAAVEREAQTSSGLKALGVEELRTLLESQDTTRVVRQLIERVVLEPSLDCQIQLKRQASPNELWRGMASPGRPLPQTQGWVLPVAHRLRA
jgi:site-specific DNA recombinase